MSLTKAKINLIKIYAAVIILIISATLSNDAHTESFNFDEYKAVPWGDIVSDGKHTYFCYGYPPGAFGDQIHAKCLRIDNKKFQRCKLTDAIHCENEI